MEIISALLTLCEGNPLVTAGFLSHVPWRGTLMFSLILNKQFSKQSRRCWFETPLRSLWRHCNGIRYPSSVCFLHCTVLWRHHCAITSQCSYLAGWLIYWFKFIFHKRQPLPQIVIPLTNILTRSPGNGFELQILTWALTLKRAPSWNNISANFNRWSIM